MIITKSRMQKDLAATCLGGTQDTITSGSGMLAVLLPNPLKLDYPIDMYRVKGQSPITR